MKPYLIVMAVMIEWQVIFRKFNTKITTVINAQAMETKLKTEDKWHMQAIP